MGKKKPNARGDDEVAYIANPSGGGGGTKSKKKALIIDDDEYSLGTEVSEDLSIQEDLPAKNKEKKGNAKGGKKQQNSVKDEEDDVEDPIEIVFSGKKKSHGTKGGGKNSKLSSSNFSMLDSDDAENDNEDDTSKAEVTIVKSSGDEEEDLVVSFAGMKKKKRGKSTGKPSISAFSALMGDDEGISVDEDEDEQQVGKANLHEKNEGMEDDDLGLISFSGKKKKSSKGSKRAAEKLEKETNDEQASISLSSVTVDEDVAEDGDDESLVSFAGKKKSSKASKKPLEKLERETHNDASSLTGNDGDEDGDDISFVSFAGKKKSSKKKGTSNAFSAVLDDEVSEVAEITEKTVEALPVEDAKVFKTEEITETSKNKKKKKKSNRTAQEEEDLDKILAELGEASTATISKEEDVLPPQVEAVVEPVVEDADGEKNEEEEKEESAAAKKKKKKKEKEKEKKAAALSAAEKTEDAAVEREPKKLDAKAKVADKKVPKHVREMQEAIARRKEMEERKAREEEEKRRKEEEERKRLEELERIAEEEKKRKKEREKEKLLKKKQEGKLLTGKQKEEQKRLEAMRNQFLANTGVPIAPGDKDTKRPKYQTKKSKQPQQRAIDFSIVKEEAAIEHVESFETDLVEEVESEAAEVKTETLNDVNENGQEDEDDWDAKNWDDVDIDVKGAFDDEEDQETIIKKESNPSLLNKEKAILTPKQVSEQQANTQRNLNSQVAPQSDAPTSNSSEPLGKTETLRSPICCIMGHVDTGKTKLLDCIRGTNVQEGEAGGITQQIGATYFPAENIRERTKELKADANLKVPGLLVIDTPGHESFTNLRSRGSGLCDIAILVVDIMHGLEPQTIESLNLLKLRNTEFIVALNKVDRLYGWKVCRNAPIQKAMKMQSKDVINEFNMRLVQIITQFKEQGLNTELYYKNKEMGETYSIVPTSAISGEGIPDMLLLLVHWTQKTMVKKLTYSEEVQCTVLEVKVVEGHGTTIDVVLVNGVLHEGDQIIVCGSQGPIVTSIRALLTPHPMKELRVKGTYLHHKEIKAAQGIKITAQGLEHAIAGTALYVVGPGDDVEDMKEVAMQDMKQVMSRIDKSGEGVYVQASTLGALEALLEFLKSPAVSIPVSGIGIGPVHKKDVMKASVMLEKKKEYATILAFDVKVTPEARELADELGVTIFIADIIYHLFDQFKAYITKLRDEKKKEVESEAVFPCILKIMPNCVFMKKDPIVLGVDVVDGVLRVGTPVCIPQREFIDIGKIASIENNHKAVDSAKKGQQVAIKIVGTNPEEQQKMFGRHFDYEDELVSHISRKSIDVLKANYREDLSIDEWKLVVKLKNLFKIQ